MTSKQGFSQRHPFLFGLFLIILAVALITGAMAFFRFGAFGQDFAGFNPDKVGEVRINGLITSSKKVTDWIEKLEDDNSIKGVLIRVNSPGGVMGPSYEIFRAVKHLNSKKPVVVSMGSVAASGGYYVSVPSRLIVATPCTLTGSIGVKIELTNLTGLMAKLGIGHELIASGALKGAGSPFADMTPEERSYLKALVEDLHDQFVTDIVNERRMELSEVEKIADGRGLTGRQALELGLVDKLGTRSDALNMLAGLCDIEDTYKVISGPPKEDPGLLYHLLKGSIDHAVEGMIAGLAPKVQ